MSEFTSFNINGIDSSINASGIILTAIDNLDANNVQNSIELLNADIINFKSEYKSSETTFEYYKTYYDSLKSYSDNNIYLNSNSFFSAGRVGKKAYLTNFVVYAAAANTSFNLVAMKYINGTCFFMYDYGIYTVTEADTEIVIDINDTVHLLDIDEFIAVRYISGKFYYRSYNTGSPVVTSLGSGLEYNLSSKVTSYGRGVYALCNYCVLTEAVVNRINEVTSVINNIAELTDKCYDNAANIINCQTNVENINTSIINTISAELQPLQYYYELSETTFEYNKVFYDSIKSRDDKIAHLQNVSYYSPGRVPIKSYLTSFVVYPSADNTTFNVVSLKCINGEIFFTHDYGIFTADNADTETVIEINDTIHLLDTDEYIAVKYLTGSFYYSRRVIVTGNKGIEYNTVSKQIIMASVYAICNYCILTSATVGTTKQQIGLINYITEFADKCYDNAVSIATNESNIESLTSSIESNASVIESLTKTIDDVSVIKTESHKYSYIDVFNDDFSEVNADWTNTDNWKFDTTNKTLTPMAAGSITSNVIKLNRPYNCDKTIYRVNVLLYSDTVINLMGQRSTDNTGEGESCFRVDCSSKKLIMLSTTSSMRGVIDNTSAAEGDISFDIIDGNEYIIEIEKDDYTYYLRIFDVLSGDKDEISLVGWGAGRFNVYFSLSLNGGTAFKLKNVRIMMLNNPIVAFAGDSITEGVGMSSATLLPYRYAEIMRNKVGKCVISAMGGDNIDTIISKFDSEYSIYKPSYLSIHIGTNGGISTNTKSKFQTVINNCIDNNIMPIINLISCGKSGAYINVNNAILELAESPEYRGKFYYCRFDYATAVDNYPWVDDAHLTTVSGYTTRVDTSLMSDGTHPNKTGSIEMAKRFDIDCPIVWSNRDYDIN